MSPLAIDYRPSTNCGSRDGHDILGVVLHADADDSEDGTIRYITLPNADGRMVAYHYLVGRTGHVYQFVDEHRSAWAVGVSAWPEVPDADVGNSINKTTISVCLANNNAGEAYPEAELQAAADLVSDICDRNNLDPATAITTHAHTARPPGRKTDPAPPFSLPDFLTRITGG